ncbi:hypothetical protein BDW69DRAFT_175736 [Aspergillus filifer]
MGEVKFVDFQKYPIIGTEGLGGCSVVILASRFGAILAHIPVPQPHQDGCAITRHMMAEVRSLHNHYRRFFHSADSAVVCSKWYLHNRVVLRDEREIMERTLRDMGYHPSRIRYVVPHDNYSGHGTAFV